MGLRSSLTLSEPHALGCSSVASATACASATATPARLTAGSCLIFMVGCSLFTAKPLRRFVCYATASFRVRWPARGLPRSGRMVDSHAQTRRKRAPATRNGEQMKEKVAPAEVLRLRSGVVNVRAAFVVTACTKKSSCCWAFNSAQYAPAHTQWNVVAPRCMQSIAEYYSAFHK